MPFYGYFAIAGGVLVSLLVGGGLMGLVFYSSRHGYDDINDRAVAVTTVAAVQRTRSIICQLYFCANCNLNGSRV